MKTIYGVQIFAEGTWNGTTFTAEDVDMIITSFEFLGLGGKIPLKLGHEGPDIRHDPRTQFAMGWVERVYRNGRYIEADFSVPDTVYSLIKEGMLKFVSVELLHNVKAANREIPWVLDAVALLGSDQPAVGILDDLQALTMSRSPNIGAFSEVVQFSKTGKTIFKSQGDTKTMSDGNITQKELLERLEALTLKVDSLSTENSELKKFRTEAESLRRRLKETDETMRERELTQHRADIKRIFEEAISTERITPATRERFFKSYKVETEAVMDIELDDVREFIKENETAEFRNKKKGRVITLSRSNDEAPDDMTPDVELLQRAKAYCRERDMDENDHNDLQKAVVAIFKSNRELGTRYKFMPDEVNG